MKRTFSLLFVTLAVMLGLSMAAFAQDPVNMYFTGTTLGGSIAGVEAGPYVGTINGGPDVNFVCDDDTNLTQDNWTAVVGQTFGVSSTVRFQVGSSPPANINPTYAYNGTSPLTEQELYNVITWLAMQILGPNTSGYSNAQLNGAIWDLTDNFCGAGGHDAGNCGNDGIANALTTALNYKDTYNGDLIVYTPTSGYLSTDQEFLATPEPLNMALMGTFLILAGLALGRKKLFS